MEVAVGLAGWPATSVAVPTEPCLTRAVVLSVAVPTEPCLTRAVVLSDSVPPSLHLTRAVVLYVAVPTVLLLANIPALFLDAFRAVLAVEATEPPLAVVARELLAADALWGLLDAVRAVHAGASPELFVAVCAVHLFVVSVVLSSAVYGISSRPSVVAVALFRKGTYRLAQDVEHLVDYKKSCGFWSDCDRSNCP